MPSKTKFKFRWFHGVLFFVFVNLIGGYLITRFVDIKEIYSVLIKPWFAPPVFLFGLAWTTNNILTIIGNIWTLNLQPSLDRTRLLWLQGLSWFNFCVFQYLSFGLFEVYGKPLVFMFFWPTFSMLILTIASIFYSYKLDTSDMEFIDKVKSGRSITMTLTSLISWLVIATGLGFQIWMLNR